jgi:hypothetical protein
VSLQLRSLDIGICVVIRQRIGRPRNRVSVLGKETKIFLCFKTSKSTVRCTEVSVQLVRRERGGRRRRIRDDGYSLPSNTEVENARSFMACVGKALPSPVLSLVQFICSALRMVRLL